MGEFLLGGEKSGTPIETRAGTQQFSNLLSRLMQGGGAQGVQNITAPFQALTTDAIMSLFSDPRVGGVVQDVLRSPEDMTRGLFASMAPFEQRETERQAAELRNLFGSLGGRFGRGVATGEAELRGELGNQFARARQEALLAAQGQRAGSLFNLLGTAGEQARLSALPFQFLPQYLAPGAPQFREGILPSLISSGATIAALLATGGNPAAGTAAGTAAKKISSSRTV